MNSRLLVPAALLSALVPVCAAAQEPAACNQDFDGVGAPALPAGWRTADATPGAGWEMFMQFGNTLLQDKIMIGLSRQTFGGSYEDLIAEYEALPLRDNVKDKWFYLNAARVFRIE